MLFSQASFALIDAQVLLGRRNMTLDLGKENALSGNETRVAVHLDPIPLVPVAFGVSYGMVSSSDEGVFTLTNADDYKVTETEGHELAVELMVWSPIDLFSITPYLKAGYVLYGAYQFNGQYTVPVTGDVEDLDLVYGTSGSLITLGLKWSPLPLVGLLFEAQNTQNNLSFDKLEEAAGVSTGIDSPSASASSWSYMIGLEVESNS